jgi:ankyrin repeat protein
LALPTSSTVVFILCYVLGVTALGYAAESNCLEILEILLQQNGINVNLPEENGKNVFLECAGKGKIEMVKLLLKHPEIDVIFVF